MTLLAANENNINQNTLPTVFVKRICLNNTFESAQQDLREMNQLALLVGPLLVYGHL